MESATTTRGAPKGNKNQSKTKPWTEALTRALLEKDGKKLRAIADKLVEKVMDGDIQAIKEIGDRVEGKALQSLEAKVDASVTVEVVRFADQAS